MNVEAIDGVPPNDDILHEDNLFESENSDSDDSADDSDPESENMDLSAYKSASGIQWRNGCSVAYLMVERLNATSEIFEKAQLLT